MMIGKITGKGSIVSEEFIEIIGGNGLNKTIEDKHLGKTFREIINETHTASGTGEEDIDFFLPEKLNSGIPLLNDKNFIALISKNEDASIKIIKLSNIIMKIAVKYTRDIFLKKKNKELLKEVQELVSIIGDVKDILLDMQKNISENG